MAAPKAKAAILTQTGISYKGAWKNGLMDGSGTLMLPVDEYVGEMRAGKANGSGRYIDITGEIFEGSFIDGERDGLARQSCRTRAAIGPGGRTARRLRTPAGCVLSSLEDSLRRSTAATCASESLSTGARRVTDVIS